MLAQVDRTLVARARYRRVTHLPGSADRIFEASWPASTPFAGAFFDGAACSRTVSHGP